MTSDRAFDFFQLDAETTNLNLIVRAAEKF